MADPGFPREGTNPRGWAPTYYLANFFRKLHGNEEISGRGGCTSFAPPRSANDTRRSVGATDLEGVFGYPGDIIDTMSPSYSVILLQLSSSVNEKF